MRRVMPAVVVATAVLTCALTACGSSKSTTSTGTQSTGKGSTTTQTGANTGAAGINDGLGHPVNVCSLMPAATIAQLSGEPITVATEQDTPGYKLYTCNYTSASGTSGLTISVLAMDAAAGFDGRVQADSSSKAISGLGDKASSGVLGLIALFGNVSITVTDLQSDAASEQIIRALQPKL